MTGNNCLVYLGSQPNQVMAAAEKNAEHSGIGHVFKKLLREIGDPVDFELPDSLHKGTSAPYSFIKRNLYLTKNIKKEDAGVPCSCNSLPGSPGVCGVDCICGMVWSSCSSDCKCGSSCLNKPFQRRPVKKMKLVQTENCGSGIVADEDIKQGEFIIEYVGEVIDDRTCEERLWKMKDRGETNFYLCEISRDMVIDATFKGNKSRYINHSCSPNTEMQKWTSDREIRIGIFATRDIKKGDHLTYDYQFVQFGADQDCHCGAVGCRQKLGVKPNKLKRDAALKLVEREVAVTAQKVKTTWSKKNANANGVPHIGSKRDSAARRRCPRLCIGEVITIIRPANKRLFGVVKRFDQTTKKHLIMLEDGSRKSLDLSKEDWEFCNSRK